MINIQNLPENMGELNCVWRDDLGECPNNCPFSDLCLDCSPSDVKIEAIFRIFEKPKKVFQKCKTCPFSRKSWKKKYVYYCSKHSTYHPKGGGCYVEKLTPKKKEEKEKSWAVPYGLVG